MELSDANWNRLCLQVAELRSLLLFVARQLEDSLTDVGTIAELREELDPFRRF